MDTCHASPADFARENNVVFPDPDPWRWEEGGFSDSLRVNRFERAGAARLRVLKTLTPAPTSLMERLGLPAKTRRRPLFRGEVPRGDVLMHDGMEENRPFRCSGYRWRGEYCPLALLNPRLVFFLPG